VVRRSVLPPLAVRAVVSAVLLAVGVFAPTGTAVAGGPLVGDCSVSAPTTPAGWQRAFDNLNSDTWSGGDQTASTRLPDGRVLWLFGDTFQGGVNPDGSRAAGTRLVHNSLVIADRGCLRGVSGPSGAEVVPNTSDGQFFWLQQGFFAAGALYATAIRVRKTGPGDFDFATTGTFLVRFAYAPGGTPTFAALYGTPASGTPDATPLWGAGVAQADGYTYFYGTRSMPGILGDALYVARVPSREVTVPAAWRFSTGTTWSATPGSARPVSVAGGVSTSLSVWRCRDAIWCGLTKSGGAFGKAIVLLSARAPTGPWTETVVGLSPSLVHPGEFTYNSLAHPEIPLADGALLISTNRNTLDRSRLMADADLYKPQFSETTRCPCGWPARAGAAADMRLGAAC
jgi:hypothetical protein